MTSPTTPRAIARWIAEQSALFDDGPFSAQVSRTGSPRLLVVTGENASGKSMFVRVLAARARAQRGWLPLTVSIRERAGGGMRAAIMFGEESTSSTGTLSYSVIRRAFERNLDRPGGTLVILDEPELGMSEGYAHALGVYIAQRSADLPKGCRGVVVVTHSRPLVRGLLDHAPARWTHVDVGSGRSLQDWLEHPEVRTVADLDKLERLAHERFQWAAQFLRD